MVGNGIYLDGGDISFSNCIFNEIVLPLNGLFMMLNVE